MKDDLYKLSYSFGHSAFLSIFSSGPFNVSLDGISVVAPFPKDPVLDPVLRILTSELSLFADITLHYSSMRSPFLNAMLQIGVICFNQVQSASEGKLRPEYLDHWVCGVGVPAKL